jgi:hypothetical protein
MNKETVSITGMYLRGLPRGWKKGDGLEAVENAS